MKFSPRSALALSALLLLGASAAAVAAPNEVGDVASKTVRFNDLDLSTGNGAQKLYERISAAARVVCRGAPHTAVRTCRNRAVDEAVRTVGSALLSSIHRTTADRVEEVVLR
jgi:UrcA family protein